MIIDELLGDSVTRFPEEHYLKLPLARSSGCEGLATLGNWEVIERLLSRPGVDALAGRGGQRWPGDEIRPANARSIVAAGYTLGIRHAQQLDEALAQLAAEFEAAFGGAVDVHLYCTPAGEPGFGWHYDAEEVFILQTVGSKRWRLRKNTVHPWPLIEAIPQDQRYEREIMPVMECNLLAGDWLYIPGGYWHSTQAGEESISLSVGVRAPTAMNIYDFLRRELLDSIRWRQRLPVASPTETGGHGLEMQLQELCAELGADLARQLRDAGFVRRFLQSRGA